MSGCAPSLPNRGADVEARIDAFLKAVRDGTDGSGWNHLRGDVKAAYPGGGNAWVAAIAQDDPSGLKWTIGEVTVDDFVGCARVDFGETRGEVPFTLYDDRLPAPARVAISLSSGPFHICATVGPLPFDAGIHGAG